MHKSKATYSWAFLKTESIIGVIAIIVFFLLAFFLFPKPANIVFAMLLGGIGLVFLILNLIIKKNFYGVVTEIQGDTLKIYKSLSFLLQPKENELLLSYGKSLQGACVITKNNIISVRKIDNPTEINQFKSLFNQKINLQIIIVNILANFETLKKLLFVTSYTNIVELQLQYLSVNYNGVQEIKPATLYVSVKDPHVLLDFKR
jgi:hypothetical protein